MAKKSAVNRNEMVRKLVKRYAAKRDALKAIANDDNRPLEERFEARLQLAALPRNSSASAHPQPLRRHRPSARLYRTFKMSRIALRELGNGGPDPRAS